MSSVTKRLSSPGSVLIVRSPYGCTNVYSVSGSRPEVTFRRRRAKTICWFASGGPLKNAPSSDATRLALPNLPAVPVPTLSMPASPAW